MVVVRDGGTLFIQPRGQTGVPLEAMAENKFRLDPMPEFEFDAEKGLMTITRGKEQRVFTKEK
jgi:hypothetical protein